MKSQYYEHGSVNPLVISNVLLGVLAVGFGSVMIWALVNYSDQKDNTDSKINAAVTVAKKEQVTLDEKNFVEREKSPYEQYVGPKDLGNVTISYPKTWSVYVAETSSEGMEVYLHPKIVPIVRSGQQFATEIKVLSRSLESTLQQYDGLVKKGTLKSTPVVINGFPGTRLDGTFSGDIKGSMVLFKLRDKTLVLATDAETFKNDFNTVILKSLDYNP